MFFKFCVFSDKKIRVDIYLSALFGDFSRSYIQKIIDRGQIKVNNKIVSKNLKISPRDEIEIEIKLQSLDSVEPQNINLDIVFEDENILAINKKTNFNMHPVPGENGNSGTLVNAILYHCKGNLPSIGGVERPGIVHRLDKDTSGIVLVAKTDNMMNYLSSIIKDRKIKKTYIAIVDGIIKENNFRVESYIGRDPLNRLKMTTKNPLNPKIAISNFKLLGTIHDKYSILEVNIETGRTHQIRVHLSSIGFPIIGDKVYNTDKNNKKSYQNFSIERQALHAYSLEFDLYGKKVLFKAKLKKDMKSIIPNGIIK